MTVTVKAKAGFVVPPSVQRQVSSGRTTITPAAPTTYKPTQSEFAAIRKGEAAIARGEHVSSSDFLHGLDRHRRKAGAKASREVSR